MLLTASVLTSCSDNCEYYIHGEDYSDKRLAEEGLPVQVIEKIPLLENVELIDDYVQDSKHYVILELKCTKNNITDNCSECLKRGSLVNRRILELKAKIHDDDTKATIRYYLVK